MVLHITNGFVYVRKYAYDQPIKFEDLGFWSAQMLERNINLVKSEDCFHSFNSITEFLGK